MMMRTAETRHKPNEGLATNKKDTEKCVYAKTAHGERDPATG